jgi:hypothetical protein
MKEDSLKQLGALLAVIGAILSGFFALMEKSGLSADIAARYGESIKVLVWVVMGVALVVFSLRLVQNYELMGAGAEAAGTSLRDEFDALRASLAAHRDNEDAYARRLKKFLAWLDAFLNDKGEPTQRAFVLREPAHLWTAPALDRCLLLALIYPVMAIFVTWAITGEAEGPAEQALGFKSATGVERLLVLAPIMIGALSYRLSLMSEGWRSFGEDAFAFFSAITLVAGLYHGVAPAVAVVALVAASANAFPGAKAGASTVRNALYRIGAGAGASAVAFVVEGAVLVAVGIAIVVALYHAVASADTLAIAIVVAVAVGLVVVVFALAGPQAARYLVEASSHRRLPFFPAAANVFLLLLCVAGARFLPALGEDFAWVWREGVGPILLFLGLLTLINAPFDWLSLGLTRLLLRWGIEVGGPAPWILALVDALVASLLLILLALAMVSATDLFNHLAERGGGDKARILPKMQDYLSMLRDSPRDPKFWWIYATLFSTMLPSIANLFIAGFSFLRGLPQSRAFLLRVMRPGETMPVGRRFSTALILTLQGAVAVLFALGAQGLLAYGVLWRFLPWLGADILDIAAWAAL